MYCGTEQKKERKEVMKKKRGKNILLRAYDSDHRIMSGIPLVLVYCVLFLQLSCVHLSRWKAFGVCFSTQTCDERSTVHTVHKVVHTDELNEWISSLLSVQRPTTVFYIISKRFIFRFFVVWAWFFILLILLLQ